MAMDKLTGIKIKYENGTYSDEIPVGAFAVNVGWDSTHTLVDIIGDIDIATDGSLQDQIDALLANTYTKTQVDAMIPTTLPNPQKLTINNTEYDGSTAVTLTIDAGDTDTYTATVESQLPLHIDNAVAGQMKSISFQTETGDPTTSGGGITVFNKNLFDLFVDSQDPSTTVNGITFAKDTTSEDPTEAGKFTITGSFTLSGEQCQMSQRITNGGKKFKAGETYTLSSYAKAPSEITVSIDFINSSGGIRSASTGQNDSTTFTIPANFSPVDCQMHIYWIRRSDNVNVNETIYPMLEVGSIATSYVACQKRVYSDSQKPVLFDGANTICALGTSSNASYVTAEYTASKTLDTINDYAYVNNRDEIERDTVKYLNRIVGTLGLNILTPSINFATGAQITKATGAYSIAGGSGIGSSNASKASHNNSIAYGLGVQTGKNNQVVFGQYNTVDSGASLVIGVGADNSTRANAFTAGNDTVNNYITIGTKKITDIDAGILKKLTPSRNLCVVDDAHLVKPDFWTGDWDGPWKNTKGFTCNQPSYLAAKGGGFWYHLQAGTYTFGCDVKYYQTTTTQVYYIFHFSPDSNPTALTDLTERILTEPLTPRIELTFTLPEAGTLIFRPTSYANSGGDYKTRYENVQIEVGNMATEYEPYRDYYTIGDALITTGSTAPTSTLTGNIYLANGYGYGPDGSTFSKFITKSDLTDETAAYPRIACTVPYLNYQIVECTNAFNSQAYEAYLKYIVANFASLINNRPFSGTFYSGDTTLIYGLVESTESANINAEGLPVWSKCLIVRNNGDLYAFGTQKGTFYFKSVSGGGASGDYLPLSGGTLTGLVTSNYSIGGETTAAFVAQHGVSSRDAGFKARRTDTGVSIRLIVGSGGVNHGVYSDALGKWMVYGDASSVHLNGNADTSSAVLDYANGTVTKLGYSTARMTSFTHLACWDTSVSGEYRLRSAVPQDLRNLMGLGNTTGALPIANGGTGASTVAGAMSNLGAVYRNANSYSVYKSEKQSTFINFDENTTISGVTFPRYAKGALSTNSSNDATLYAIDTEGCLYTAFRNNGTWVNPRKYGTTPLYGGTLASGSVTLTNATRCSLLVVVGICNSESLRTSTVIPTYMIPTSDTGFQINDESGYVTFNVKVSGANMILTIRSKSSNAVGITNIYGIN